jgi:hypothetical protein
MLRKTLFISAALIFASAVLTRPDSLTPIF